MTTIELTAETRQEIIKTISFYQKLIDKENQISQDLRYHDKVTEWTATIEKFIKYLTQGYIN